MEDTLRLYTKNLKKFCRLPDSVSNKLRSNANLSKKADINQSKVTIFTFTYDVDGIDVAGFLITPKENDSKIPLVIYNRGGTGDFGLVNLGLMYTHLADIASKGYAVIGTQYHGNQLSAGHDERGGESDIQSINNLYALAQKLPGLDADKTGMYGFSRGGMMTYICLKRFNWIKAAVILAGTADIDNEIRRRPAMASIYSTAFGDDPEARKNRSAIYWADKLPQHTPLLLLHADSDPKVDPLDSIRMAQNLTPSLDHFSLLLLDSAEHSLEDVADVRNDAIIRWFDTYLQ